MELTKPVSPAALPAEQIAEQTAEQPKPAVPPKPFEYKILNEEWCDTIVGRAVIVEIEVIDEVAPTVTEADLESLVPVFMEKYNGGSFRIVFYAETPLIQPWGVINHTPHNTLGETLSCNIYEYAFEFGPWYFPEKIDPNEEWHELVWLTLPMVNKIVNNATQYEWDIKSRSANDVYFKPKRSTLGSLDDGMSLDPQTWEISSYDGDVPGFVRLVESSLNYLDYDLSQNVVGKLNSVIGSQEYLRGDKHFWTWKIDRREVTFNHFDSQDSLTIMQTQP